MSGIESARRSGIVRGTGTGVATTGRRNALGSTATGGRTGGAPIPGNGGAGGLMRIMGGNSRWVSSRDLGIWVGQGFGVWFWFGCWWWGTDASDGRRSQVGTQQGLLHGHGVLCDTRTQWKRMFGNFAPVTRLTTCWSVVVTVDRMFAKKRLIQHGFRARWTPSAERYNSALLWSMAMRSLRQAHAAASELLLPHWGQHAPRMLTHLQVVPSGQGGNPMRV